VTRDEQRAAEEEGATLSRVWRAMSAAGDLTNPPDKKS